MRVLWGWGRVGGGQHALLLACCASASVRVVFATVYCTTLCVCYNNLVAYVGGGKSRNAAGRTTSADSHLCVSCSLPQGLRQQLLQQQTAASRAESAAKADSSAAVHASKQLALQEKQHKAEVGRGGVVWGGVVWCGAVWCGMVWWLGAGVRTIEKSCVCVRFEGEASSKSP